MMQQMKHANFTITPISPIHIGCGEDYEPTSYVFDSDKKLLYGFNPANAVLDASQKNQLLAKAQSGSIREINRFYRDNADIFKPWANEIIPTDTAFDRAYRKMIDPKGNQKNTQLFVMRTTYVPGIDGSVPYIPGSGLKGCIVTALVDRLNRGEGGWDKKNKAVAQLLAGKQVSDGKQLIDGNFAKSPMRFVKVGDFSARKNICRRINIGRRFFKDNNSYAGIDSYFEVIEPAQYRAFAGSVFFAPSVQRSEVPNTYKDAKPVLRDLHRYSKQLFDTELRNSDNETSVWATSVKRLIDQMENKFASGNAALILIGKNTGADAKTLHGRNVAKIEIRHRKADKEILDAPTTWWLAGDKTIAKGEKQYGCGLPFGWAVIELDDGTENKILADWCDRESARLGIKDTSMLVANERTALASVRSNILKRREQELAAQEELRLKREQEAAAEAARQKELASMSANKRAVAEALAKINAAPGNIASGTTLFNEIKKLITVDAPSWNDAADKLYAAEQIGPLLKKKGMYVGKAEKEFKAALRKLRGEA